ncbi:UNVERIFIED_CONTAM: hypothetical protein GTU68_020616 [Idotea baltica]|nr:hypothetical protein [Idotea baltica]
MTHTVEVAFGLAFIQLINVVSRDVGRAREWWQGGMVLEGVGSGGGLGGLLALRVIADGLCSCR